jgi:hypothetical protein
MPGLGGQHWGYERHRDPELTLAGIQSNVYCTVDMQAISMMFAEIAYTVNSVDVNSSVSYL